MPVRGEMAGGGVRGALYPIGDRPAELAEGVETVRASESLKLIWTPPSDAQIAKIITATRTSAKNRSIRVSVTHRNLAETEKSREAALRRLKP